jgi:hypothetical protein
LSEGAGPEKPARAPSLRSDRAVDGGPRDHFVARLSENSRGPTTSCTSMTRSRFCAAPFRSRELRFGRLPRSWEVPQKRRCHFVQPLGILRQPLAIGLVGSGAGPRRHDGCDRPIAGAIPAGQLRSSAVGAESLPPSRGSAGEPSRLLWVKAQVTRPPGVPAFDNERIRELGWRHRWLCRDSGGPRESSPNTSHAEWAVMPSRARQIPRCGELPAGAGGQ